MKYFIQLLTQCLFIFFMYQSLISQNIASHPQYRVVVEKDRSVQIFPIQMDSVDHTHTQDLNFFQPVQNNPDIIQEVHGLPNLVNYTGGGSSNHFFYYDDVGFVEFETSVRNMGAENSGPCHILWYFDTGMVYSSNSHVICDAEIPSLKPFAPPNYEFVNLLNAKYLSSMDDILPGTYYAGWVINPYNEITESDMSDNTGHWDAPHVILAPNLCFDDSYGDVSFEYNELTFTVIYNYSIVNQGDAMAKEYRIGYYLTRNKDNITGDAVLLHTDTKNDFKTSQRAVGSLQMQIQGFDNMQSGKYYGAIYIDDLSQVQETWENDNIIIFQTGFDWTSTMKPQVSAITPKDGENTGPVVITNLSGSGFDIGAQVYLHMQGQDNISAENINVISINKISCEFDLTHAAPGKWDVIVRNPNGKDSGSSGDNLFSVNALASGLILVTTTEDSVYGSLRSAINAANTHPGADTIQFEIPQTDPGFDASIGVWILKPLSPFDHITDDSTIIDGNSQTLYAGDLNAEGPEILLKGGFVNDTIPPSGLCLNSSFNVVKGLIINRFPGSGIFIEGPDANNNLIIDNYIGVNAKADTIDPNTKYGIQISKSSGNSIGYIEFDEMDTKKPKTKYGPRTNHNNLAESVITNGNLIAGNLSGGILVVGSNAENNSILANNIIANNDDGITLAGGASHNLIFYNVISLNQGHGVEVFDAMCLENTITVNSIYANELEGIYLNGGNNMLAAPVIQSVSSAMVAGTSPANCTIEIYADQENEGEMYLGSTQSNELGEFVYSGFVCGPNVTAIAIDQAGNTSQFSAPLSYSENPELVVSTTTDNGPGSFRDALEQANNLPGENTIIFNLPLTDPNYDENTGVWRIQPQTPLPIITDNDLVINGFSQGFFVGMDINPLGPDIELNGSLLTEATGLMIYGDRTIVAGLAVNQFQKAGVTVRGAEGGFICGCFLGTDPTGQYFLGNESGVRLSFDTKYFIVGTPDSTLPGNLLSGNFYYGVVITDSSSNNYVVDNIIGLDLNGTILSESNSTGVLIAAGSDSNHVEGNSICENQDCGVKIIDSNENMLLNNMIGTDSLFQTDLGNNIDGVQIKGESINNMIFGNYIGYNKNNGITVWGNEAVQNCISNNLISQNELLGIHNKDGGNFELTPPQIYTADMDMITGNAGANQKIELYTDTGNQGQILLGNTTSDGEGDFKLTLINISFLENVTAIAIDDLGNTSEFSNEYITRIDDSSKENLPVTYKLHQNFPNPFNPVTTIEFELACRTRVVLEIFDIQGKMVKRILDSFCAPGVYQETWNGRNADDVQSSSGIYLYRLKAGNFVETKRMILLK